MTKSWLLGRKQNISQRCGGQPSSAGRFGFTLVELLVVIGVIALLIAILLPSLNRAREASRRIKCGANLRSIGQAFMIYAAENRGNFPRTYWLDEKVAPWRWYWSSPDTFAGYRGFTNPTALDPFTNRNDPLWDQVSPPWNTTKRPGDNDMTATLFLLLRTYNLPSATFVCPSRQEFFPDRFDSTFAAGTIPNATRDPKKRSNFSSPFNLSYSVTNMFPPLKAVKMGWKWRSDANAGFAIMADLNPGERYPGSCVVTVSGLWGGTGPQTPSDGEYFQRRANSRNHQRQGQNVLYADGHVTWNSTAFCGFNQDNIYTMALDNQWTSVATMSYDSNAWSQTWDSQMQPMDTATLSTVGGLGIN